MNNIVLEKEKIFRGNLRLINPNAPIHSNNKDNLIVIDKKFHNVLMRPEAAASLRHIFKKITSSDEIVSMSGFRSTEEQEKIYKNSMKENGEEFTKKFVALPKHSEHESGLAIDLGMGEKNMSAIDPEFPYEGVCNEFRRLAPEYGFIQRYESGKEEITGIAHEPWHFRYVGYPHSKIISDNKISLEEYIEGIKNFKYGKKHLSLKNEKKYIEIFYIKADENESTTISIPKGSIYQISGNNVDGFIVTIWRDRND